MAALWILGILLALIVAAALVLYLLQNRKWSRRLFMAAGICAAGMLTIT